MRSYLNWNLALNVLAPAGAFIVSILVFVYYWTSGVAKPFDLVSPLSLFVVLSLAVVKEVSLANRSAALLVQNRVDEFMAITRTTFESPLRS